MPIQKTIIAILLAIPFFSKSENLAFSIKGKLLDPKNVNTLHIFAPGTNINDTVDVLKDGSFEFSGQLANPSWIVFQIQNIGYCMIWGDKGVINLELKATEISNSNSKPYKQLEINSITGPPETELEHILTVAYTKIALNHLSRTAETTDSILHEFFPIFKKYALERPTSTLLASLLATYMFQITEKKELYSLLKFNPNNIDNVDVQKTLNDQIAQLEQFQAGNKIQDFTQNDSTGKPINLHSIKSKFILLKFWASNCGPCRAENPGLVKLYAQYHFKGLEIVGISLDNLKADWVKALNKDQTPWINISDLNGFESDLVKRFNLYVIPFSIFLDENYAVIKLNPSFDAIKKVIDNNLLN